MPGSLTLFFSAKTKRFIRKINSRQAMRRDTIPVPVNHMYNSTFLLSIPFVVVCLTLAIRN
ncbi:MAG: hypothetical protein MZV64_20645, partial [Ignavibacteriales bacterium]|nr:hypothetical protein [Ignavibacteriales bacterium]